jgi:hypothetical protein
MEVVSDLPVGLADMHRDQADDAAIARRGCVR